MSIKHSHKSATWGLAIGLAIAAAAIALWGGIGLSRPARAASPVYVRTDGDDALCNGEYDAPATSAPNCAFATLGQAVHAVDSGGTVIVAAGTYTETVGIDKSLTLQGAGADHTIVDGGGSGSVFAIGPGYTVTISGATIRHGIADQGGGVYNRGALTLVDSVVLSNTATVAGGGIYNTGGSLAVGNCTVISNTALALGIGGGGGIYNSNGSLVISNCAIVSNTTLAVGIWGGGGGINNGYGSLAVHNSVIRHNSAVDSGGGIWSSGGALAIFDSVISDNAAQDDDAYGGGVFSSSPAVLTNVTVSGNIVKAVSGGIHSQHVMTLTNVTVSGNTAGSGGGVLHTHIYTMTIINATITDNKVTGSGHGIAGGVEAYAPVVFLNTIVADNENENCYGSTLNLISQGHNLEDENTCNFSAVTDFVDTDPLLRPLRDNGGPAVGQGQALLTHALSAGSPAIDAGANAGCPATDQRGVARPVDGDLDGVATCDIGAYEFRPWYIYLPLVLKKHPEGWEAILIHVRQ